MGVYRDADLEKNTFRHPHNHPRKNAFPVHFETRRIEWYRSKKGDFSLKFTCTLSWTAGMGIVMDKTKCGRLGWFAMCVLERTG